jgi:hypothetical protein
MTDATDTTAPPDFLELPDLACEAVGGADPVQRRVLRREGEPPPRARRGVARARVHRPRQVDGRLGDPPPPRARPRLVHRAPRPARRDPRRRRRHRVLPRQLPRGVRARRACALDDPLDLARSAAAPWTELLPRAPLRGDAEPVRDRRRPPRHPRPARHLPRRRRRAAARPRRRGARLGAGCARSAGRSIWPRSSTAASSRPAATCSSARATTSSSRARRAAWPTAGRPAAAAARATTGRSCGSPRRHRRARRGRHLALQGQRARALLARGRARRGRRRRRRAHRLAPAARSPLHPHRRHLFDAELRRIGRSRTCGCRCSPTAASRGCARGAARRPSPPPGLAALNAMPAEDAQAALLRCCGAARWADAMAAARPFEDVPALLRIGERTWWSLDEAIWREAFAAHPKIGDRHRRPPPHRTSSAAAGTPLVARRAAGRRRGGARRSPSSPPRTAPTRSGTASSSSSARAGAAPRRCSPTCARAAAHDRRGAAHRRRGAGEDHPAPAAQADGRARMITTHVLDTAAGRPAAASRSSSSAPATAAPGSRSAPAPPTTTGACAR